MANPYDLYIIVVDDDEDDLNMLTNVLSSTIPDCHLQTFTNGASLLASVGSISQPPQLMILDWQMPGLDGIELLIEIRRAVQFINVPIILLSTISEPDIQLKMAQYGGNGYFVKPATLSDWRSLVDQLTIQYELH
ncbi:response regulator [Nibrella saemangeumensis]